VLLKSDLDVQQTHQVTKQKRCYNMDGWPTLNLMRSLEVLVAETQVKLLRLFNANHARTDCGQFHKTGLDNLKFLQHFLLFLNEI